MLVRDAGPRRRALYALTSSYRGAAKSRGRDLPRQPLPFAARAKCLAAPAESTHNNTYTPQASTRCALAGKPTQIAEPAALYCWLRAVGIVFANPYYRAAGMVLAVCEFGLQAACQPPAGARAGVGVPILRSVSGCSGGF